MRKIRLLGLLILTLVAASNELMYGEVRNRTYEPGYWGNNNSSEPLGERFGQIMLPGQNSWFCSRGHDATNFHANRFVQCDEDDCEAGVHCDSGEQISCVGEYSANADENGVTCWDNGGDFQVGADQRD